MLLSPSNTTVEQLDRRLESLEGARTLVAGVRVQHTLEAIGAGGVDGLVAVDQRLLAGHHRLPKSTTGVLREQAKVYRREGRWLRAARG